MTRAGTTAETTAGRLRRRLAVWAAIAATSAAVSVIVLANVSLDDSDHLLPLVGVVASLVLLAAVLVLRIRLELAERTARTARAELPELPAGRRSS